MRGVYVNTVWTSQSALGGQWYKNCKEALDFMFKSTTDVCTNIRKIKISPGECNAPVSCWDVSPINMCPPYSSNTMCEPYFIHFSSGLYLILHVHQSLGLWTIYQRVLGFRLSYRTAIKLLYIAIHVTQNLYTLLHGWGIHYDGGHTSTWHWSPKTIQCLEPLYLASIACW